MGPHCGVLAASPDLLETLHPDKLLPSSNAVPERFELGTLPYELLAGTTAAVDFIASLADLAEPADGPARSGGGVAAEGAGTASRAVRPARHPRAVPPPRAGARGSSWG